MRILGIILAAVLGGATIGAAVAYVEVRPAATVAARRAAGLKRRRRRPPATHPRVEVDEPIYQFGAMQRGTTKSHEFVVRNVGHSPLTLRVGSTTCKCTIGNVSDAPIPPGESVSVKLEWSALVNPGPFRQTATILTNDPLQSAARAVGRRRSDRGDRHLSARFHVRQGDRRRTQSRPTCTSWPSRRTN